jgi:hypothetical protein
MRSARQNDDVSVMVLLVNVWASVTDASTDDVDGNVYVFVVAVGIFGQSNRAIFVLSSEL